MGIRYKGNGELAIVHKCLGCGKISTNRIAGDDYADALVALVENIGTPVVIGGLKLLWNEDIGEVRVVLYGK